MIYFLGMNKYASFEKAKYEGKSFNAIVYAPTGNEK